MMVPKTVSFIAAFFCCFMQCMEKEQQELQSISKEDAASCYFALPPEIRNLIKNLREGYVREVQLTEEQKEEYFPVRIETPHFFEKSVEHINNIIFNDESVENLYYIKQKIKSNIPDIVLSNRNRLRSCAFYGDNIFLLQIKTQYGFGLENNKIFLGVLNADIWNEIGKDFDLGTQTLACVHPGGKYMISIEKSKDADSDTWIKLCPKEDGTFDEKKLATICKPKPQNIVMRGARQDGHGEAYEQGVIATTEPGSYTYKAWPISSKEAILMHVFGESQKGSIQWVDLENNTVIKTMTIQDLLSHIAPKLDLVHITQEKSWLPAIFQKKTSAKKITYNAEFIDYDIEQKAFILPVSINNKKKFFIYHPDQKDKPYKKPQCHVQNYHTQIRRICRNVPNSMAMMCPYDDIDDQYLLIKNACLWMQSLHKNLATGLCIVRAFNDPTYVASTKMLNFVGSYKKGEEQYIPLVHETLKKCTLLANTEPSGRVYLFKELHREVKKMISAMASGTLAEKQYCAEIVDDVQIFPWFTCIAETSKIHENIPIWKIEDKNFISHFKAMLVKSKKDMPAYIEIIHAKKGGLYRILRENIADVREIKMLNKLEKKKLSC
ncbi:MAG TPA: hypothetical protein VEK38_03565 [Candidatus Bathyarchaeia archaeon]|nr:hypothetical protein [Candidatus Bathyarchaeia archaeon]